MHRRWARRWSWGLSSPVCARTARLARHLSLPTGEHYDAVTGVCTSTCDRTPLARGRRSMPPRCRQPHASWGVNDPHLRPAARSAPRPRRGRSRPAADAAVLTHLVAPPDGKQSAASWALCKLPPRTRVQVSRDQYRAACSNPGGAASSRTASSALRSWSVPDGAPPARWSSPPGAIGLTSGRPQCRPRPRHEGPGGPAARAPVAPVQTSSTSTTITRSMVGPFSCPSRRLAGSRPAPAARLRP